MQATLLSLLTLLMVSMAAAAMFDYLRKRILASVRYRDRRRPPNDITDLITSSITADAQVPVASFARIPQASSMLEFNLTNCNMNIMHSMFRTLRVTIAVILLTFVGSMTYAQTTEPTYGPASVTTDKGDYAPRSNAVFTGAGFKPGEQVQLKVKNLFRACNTVSADSSYLPWTVTADANGGFVTNWTVCDCAGDSLRLRAVGQSSHDTAYSYFSDAGPATLTNVVLELSSANSSTTYGAGGTITFKLTVDRSSNTNNETATFGISALPTGVTAAFSPNAFSSPSNDFGSGSKSVSSKTATLT
ncbi:MAG TPA: hypothetical protein VLC28_12200, partial [Flavitalea sp.]|nr:hypothetical protein [Flavitalea sp.]